MRKQKKWWWETAISLTTSKQHRSLTPVVSSSIASSGHPSSTPPSTPHNEHHQKVVLTGVDTLVITAGGAVAPSTWLVEQQKIWNDYQNSYEYGDEYSSIQFDNKWWVLKPQASLPYKYQLFNKEVGYIKVYNVDKWSSGSKTQQNIHFQFNSSYLHSFTTQQLFNEVKRILSYFFDNVNHTQIKISRVDLHTDISRASGMLTAQECQQSISRARYRDYVNDTDTIELTEEEQDLLWGGTTCNKPPHKLIATDLSNELLQKLNRMYHNQMSCGADRVITSKELQTAYWGRFDKGSLWAKVYDKTVKVDKDKDLDTPLLWELNGWNKTDTVIRTEFSMKREFLKEIDNGKFVSLEYFLNHIPDIWAFLTQKWLRLVEEVKENNSTWSVITSFWNIVTTSFDNVFNTVIRKKNYNGKITQLLAQGIGCFKQMISMGMNNNNDTVYMRASIQAIGNLLTTSYENGDIFERRKQLGVA